MGTAVLVYKDTLGTVDPMEYFIISMINSKFFLFNKGANFVQQPFALILAVAYVPGTGISPYMASIFESKHGLLGRLRCKYSMTINNNVKFF